MSNPKPFLSNTKGLSLEDIDWQGLLGSGPWHPSPDSWQDEVLYFLLVDRFSDGKEHGGFCDVAGVPIHPTPSRSTPPYAHNLAHTAPMDVWFESGRTWCGGSFAGLRDKLGYLKRMGVTALWLSPVFRQVTGSHDYHGYGIQNFLDVDPHFGTREELRDFVREAHALGIRIILDIILNHGGDVYAYEGNTERGFKHTEPWGVEGYRARSGGRGEHPFQVLEDESAWPEGAVWPRELQDPECWSRRGKIENWDAYPDYIDGDFFSLKNIRLGHEPKDPGIGWDIQRRIAEFEAGPAIRHLVSVYSFWIAYLDIDGYRIDTAKHMEPGAIRFFSNAIHEFGTSLGKEKFYLIAEIVMSRSDAVNLISRTGLDAALGLAETPHWMEDLAAGRKGPGLPHVSGEHGYFDLFSNSLQENKSTHRWFGELIVTMFDDHDQVGAERKTRFGGRGGDARFLANGLALNLCTLGIPCIYYGTEQAFDGRDTRGEHESKDHSDVFLRECMFGGRFGSFRSMGAHFFNEQGELYRLMQELTDLRRKLLPLRRGRQYLREVSESGLDGEFHYPSLIGGELRWVVAWSRIFARQEIVCAINTDPDTTLSVWVTVDAAMHEPGDEFACIYSSDKSLLGLQGTVSPSNGCAVSITVPAAGFVVYERFHQ